MSKASGSFFQVGNKSQGARRGAGTYGFCFPKFEGSVDGIDGIGTLRFSKVVGKATDEIATLRSNFVGANSLFHVESFDGITPQILYDLPQLDSPMEKRTVKSSSNMLRS